MENWDPHSGLRHEVPAEALAISLLALVVAAASAWLWPESLRELSALGWLLALVPSFLFAYHKGWGGAAVGLVLAMTLLIAVEIGAPLLLGTSIDWRIAGGVTAVLIAVALGAGGVAEALRRQSAGAMAMAFADPLTGLPNRRTLDLFLVQSFHAARRGGEISVVMFDVDRFKAYNDRFGHQAGDAALRAVAAALSRNTRSADVSGRFGGEEFLSVLPGTVEDGARVFAERVRQAVAEAELATGEPLTVSAGVAQYRPGMGDHRELLEAADAAMYVAKARGGDRVEISPDIRPPAAEVGAAERGAGPGEAGTGEREPD